MPSPDQIAAIAALAKLGQSEQQIATTVGLEIGDVETVLAGDSFVNPYVPPAPGGAGRRTIACPFAFDTPNLRTGAVVYTPTLGDILHDAWFEIDTAWDAPTTPPLGDFGDFPGGLRFGWLAAWSGATRMDDADSAGSIYDAGLSAAGSNHHPPASLLSSWISGSTLPDGMARSLPGRLTAANPIKVCVSLDGTTTGADPGSTRGAAVLYLDISTPH